MSQIAHISDIASIEAGLSSRGALTDEPNGTCQVISAKHLSPGEPYRYQAEHRLRINPGRTAGKYTIAPGDILLMSRGINNYVNIIEDIPDPTIAPAVFYIIKTHDSVDPYYLAWVMNQENFQMQLHGIRAGVGTMMVPRAHVGELTVPLPMISTQKSIAELYRLMSRERRILKERFEETEKLHFSISRDIYNSLLVKNEDQ